MQVGRVGSSGREDPSLSVASSGPFGDVSRDGGPPGGVGDLLQEAEGGPMGTRAMLASSLILIAWAGLIGFRRADVVVDSSAPYAAVWMAIGLALGVNGARDLWDGRTEPGRRPWLAWLIVGSALVTWIAARWPALAFILVESSYATTLTASVLAALIALLVAVTIQGRIGRTRWSGILRFAVVVGATSSFILIGLSIWTHLRVDHSETGPYAEVGVDLFVVEHPIFWTVGLAATFAVWWALRKRG